MGWRSFLHAAVRHPTEAAVLMLRSDRNWGLPRAVVAGELWAGSADRTVAALSRRLGTPLWQYRQIYLARFPEVNRTEMVIEMDLTDQGWPVPGNGRWMDRDILGRVQLGDEKFRQVLDEYLAGLESMDIPPERSPWCRRGWLTDVRSWIEASLPAHRVTGLVQVKQWAISNVMRVVTDGPAFYFKVSAPLRLFVNEAVVSRELARRFPGFVAPPLAVNPESGWMLVADVGSVGDDASLEFKFDAFRQLGRLHRLSMGQVDELAAVGCHDRSLEVLAGQIDSLLVDDSIASLEPWELERMETLAPRLREFCEELASHAIPPTLVHGDFHMGNLVVNPDGIVILDWSDACISHPFFDLHSLAWESDAVRSGSLAAYLEQWDGWLTEDEMDRVLELAEILRPLHHAVSYQHISAGLEAASRPELDFAGEFVRQMLTALPEDVRSG